MKPLSASTKHNIQSQLLQGKSVRQIHQELNVSIGSISKIRAGVINDTKENIPRSKVGRPAKIAKRTHYIMAIKFLTGNLKTLPDAHEFLQQLGEQPVSNRTLRNYLHYEGLHAFVKQAQPHLSPNDMQSRLDFANKYGDWTVEDWKRVVFSDETMVSRIGSFGKQFYYSNKKHRQRHQHHFIHKMQHGGGKVMLWGCITYNGVGDLDWIIGNMDAFDYVRVLRKNIKASAQFCGLDPKTFIFQHDGAKVHTAYLTQRYLRTARIKVLRWPPRSPDLNPIESVWGYMKQHLYRRYTTPPATLQELFNRMEDIWVNLPPNFLHELYEALPAKMQKLKDTKGFSSNLKRRAGRSK